MIISALLYLISTILVGIFSILPDFEVLPISFQNAWDLVGNFMANLAWTLNAQDIFTIISLAIHIEIAYWIYKLGAIIYNAIRGSGI